jgi:hypothetical protein
LHSANLQATIQAAGFVQVPPKSSFKKLLLGTGLWQYAKLSTSLKSPDELKDVACKKGQLSPRLPIPQVPVVDVVMPKEEPQLFKVKLPDVHTSVSLFTHGGTTRNTLRSLSQSFVSSSKRVCPRKSAGDSSRLL